MAEMHNPDFEKLGLENYPLWSMRMEALLTLKGLLVAVKGEGTITAKQDAEALAWLKMKVTDDILPLLASVTSAKKAWKMLQEVNDTANLAKVMALLKDLSDLELQPGEMIIKYVNRAHALQRALMSAGEDYVTDSKLAMHVLNGLPASYRSVVTVLVDGVGKDAQLDLKGKVMPALQRYEQELAREHARERGAETSATALVAKSGQRKKHEKKCWNCGEVGHYRVDCKKREGAVSMMVAL